VTCNVTYCNKTNLTFYYTAIYGKLLKLITQYVTYFAESLECSCEKLDTSKYRVGIVFAMISGLARSVFVIGFMQFTRQDISLSSNMKTKQVPASKTSLVTSNLKARQNPSKIFPERFSMCSYQEAKILLVIF
jgi:hypothetical protein